jgi:L-alanine-DL-glutamate epimerase-like enolase superfamily enzyme
LSPEEVLDEWRELHPDGFDAVDSAAAVSAVRQALADMEAGDRGTPAQDVLAEIRARLSLPEK